MNLSKDTSVKFQLGKRTKTTLSGKVVKADRYFAFVKVERVSGKFAKAGQKNILCISRKQIIQ